jgi:Flp pilus assembly protein TadB
VSRPRRFRWGMAETPIPKHPYRDSALVYAAFTLIVVLLAWASGGGLRKAILVAAAFFVVATSWSWLRWQRRLREQRRRARELEETS